MTTLVLTHIIFCPAALYDACLVDGHLLTKEVLLVLMNEWYFHCGCSACVLEFN
jgi:hypothetical protein